MTTKTLTPKQERFCHEIVKGKNQSDAYRFAFKPKHSKAKTIHEEASRVMAESKVSARITELRAPVVAETRLTALRWQAEVDRCALMDVRKLFDLHGNPLDIPALGDDEAPCIAGFEIIEEFSGKGEERVPVGYTRKFKLIDKLKALELAGKTRGYYVEKHKIEADLTLQAIILAAMGQDTR